MLNRASSLLVESLEEAAASYGKTVATHPIKVTMIMMHADTVLLLQMLMLMLMLMLSDDADADDE